MENIILYHGSKGGIRGKIAPISRRNCDFGRGFYMGTKAIQAKTLVFNKKDPMLYMVQFQLSKIDADRVLELDGIAWTMFVLYNRGELEKIKDTELYHRTSRLPEGKDIIIGPIADDTMYNIIGKFIRNEMTDKVLEKCMCAVDYGIQYVPITQKACELVHIKRKEEIHDFHNCRIAKNAVKEKAKRRVRQLEIKYGDEGHTLDFKYTPPHHPTAFKHTNSTAPPCHPSKTRRLSFIAYPDKHTKKDRYSLSAIPENPRSLFCFF